MKQCVLRRNRRTTPSRSTQRRAPIAARIIFATSLAVFLGGIGNLAWALAGFEDPKAPPGQPSTPQPQTSFELYGDLSASAPEGEDEAGQDATQAASGQETLNEASDTDAPEPQMASEDESYATPPAASAPEPSGAQQHGQSAQTHVIHHSAGREEAIYKTVHHQASVAREVTAGGKTRIEWTSCPVCGGRHASAYNERVVDHTRRVGCTACGAWHDTAYDEVVGG